MPDSLGAGQLIDRALRDAGVRNLFTLNGGHIWALYFAAEEYGIRLVDTRHEQTAAFAAEGWAKLTRECGVCALTAGPGITNGVSALATALANDTPLLMLGGASPLSTRGMGSLQEMDHLPVVRSLTKAARTLTSGEDAYRWTSELIREALSARTGPTFMDVPADVFFSSGEEPEATEHLVPAAGEHPDPDQVARAVALLRDAARPALVAGTTVWWSRAEAALVRFAEAAHVPTVLTGQARGILGPSHPLYATRARRRTLGEADLVFVVGVPLDFRLGFGNPPVIAEGARIVYVDVDGQKKHRPGAASLIGDVRAALEALAEAARDLPERSEWLESVRAAGEASRGRDAEMASADGTPIHPARAIGELAKVLDEDAVVIVDGGDFVSFAGRMIERSRPGLWLDPGPYGCLGTGAGYAIAARLAHPDRQVVLVQGDGAFGFSMADWEALVRHRLPVVSVVGNNGIWATEKHPMQQAFGLDVLNDIRPGVRYDRVVEALGGYGELVAEPPDLGPALRRAFDSGVPSVINVLTDPEAQYPRSAALI